MLKNRKYSLYHRIIFKRLMIAILALSLSLVLWLSLRPSSEKAIAGITVSGSGKVVTFGSGFYTVDNEGKVYTKAGSAIADTPETLESYSYVSYLSAPYLYNSSQLVLGSETDVIVQTGANILLEGSQHYKSLTLNGGIISQPQSNREGKINAYQYADQEWAIEFISYLKVGPGEKRKITCPQDYYSNRLGNGCRVEYSPTFYAGNPIDATSDWAEMDKIWQTDATNYEQERYSDHPTALIDNDSGTDRYYPIRIRFKNDNRNEKNEIMRVILRNDTNAVVGSSDGIDLNLLTGFNDDGELDIAEVKKAKFNYYLRDSYDETAGSHQLGWILSDLSNAYATYTNSEIDVDTFFNNGYGQVTDGIFDLCFDDNTNIGAYSEIFASSPFSKGTSTVYSAEVYHSYARSAKTINPSIQIGDPERYIDAGVDLVVAGDIVFNGGIIDLNNKGYAGYDGELRRGNDNNPYNGNRGGGYSAGSTSAGGLSSDKIPQSAAHAGAGGGGQYSDETAIKKNYYSYGSSAYANTLGSGGGSSHYSGNEPTVGGSGGGKIQIRANNVNFNNATSLITVTGGDGSTIKSNPQNYYAGGSGGSISVTANNVNINFNQVAGQYLFITKGGYNVTSTASSEGSGGYVKIATTNFNVKGVLSDEDKFREFIDSRSRFSTTTDYSGSNGANFLDLGSVPQAININNKSLTQSLTSDNRSALYPQLNISGNDKKIFANEDMNLEIDVQGMDDIASFRRRPIDLVIVSDLYALNSDNREINLQTALKNILMQIADINRQYPRSMRVAVTGIWSEGSGENVVNKVQTFARGSGARAYYLIDDPDIIAGLDGNGDPLPNTMAYEVMHYTSKNLSSGSSFGSGLEEAMRIFSSKRSVAQQYILSISPFNELYTPCISRIGESTCENYTVPLLDKTIAKNLNDNEVNLIHTAYFGNTVSNRNKGIIRKKFQDITEYIRSDSISPKVKTYYETIETSDLSNVISPILDNISGISSGMAIKIRQTLPPGTKVVSNLELVGKNNDAYSCSTSDGQITCVISSTAYSADRDYTLNPNDEIFKFKVKLNFAEVDPGWVDTQKNRECGSNGSETSALIGSPYSYAEYLPSGLYSGNTIKTTPSSCRQIVPNIISGDVFNSENYLKNFAFYGNNLNQSNNNSISGVGSSWEIKNYSSNTLSQIANYQQAYDAKISTMQGEAQTVTANSINSYPSWYLQGDALTDSANSQAESLLQGKIWNLKTHLWLGNGSSTHSYYGQGTIIIQGDLELTKGMKIIKSRTGISNNNLGLIVLGNLILNGDNELEASVYVRDSVRITGKNVKILGSIAASNFVGFDTYGKLDIRYDYKTEDKWPPGFRYLNNATNNNSTQ